jgi:hypothetical protein
MSSLATTLARLLSRRSLGRECSRPVFILGCGRSGTTVLGNALSLHPRITYLNEPRHLWFKAFPETDIWTEKALARGGKLALTAADADAVKSRKLRRLFHAETVGTSRPVLVEKLPINNFRVGFLDAIFPEARYVHIHRNGLEVARSIEKLSEEGRWFGAGDYKWEQLARFASGEEPTAELPALCDRFFHRGLLEWRLSVESAVSFLETLPEERCLEVSYRAFASTPAETVARILSFLGVEADPEVLRFAREKVSRRSSDLDDAELSPLEIDLGGRLLPRSMEAGGDGLMTRREGAGASCRPGEDHR